MFSKRIEASANTASYTAYSRLSTCELSVHDHKLLTASKNMGNNVNYLNNKR